ncbi:MAG TPA: HD domain-containing protein [Desulfobacteraceae bacterium]|nr:HD domain-containing protein [Deltaproteobacteria bacterium]MBW2355857.1 HD domain-containing protein [Deltaproteobacteria bacterium]HDI60327.1 HD domain-containing protein [Desulfobacteraceae bacterium]
MTAEPFDFLINRVRDLAAAVFEKARGSHAWDHTLRVVRLCEHIGPVEGADMATLRIAAYLHDIGRSEQDAANGRICHAERGAQRAAVLLAPLPLDDRRRANILHCIRSHRFRGRQRPETLEARVLFDADKLDAIGAVGVARAYLFAGEVGARLHCPEKPVAETAPYGPEDTGYREYIVKLQHIHRRMLTDEGRRLAEARHAFMTRFFRRFLEELDGRA